MPELSILIPARNEQFLLNTIQDILANLRGDTEIICVLDGAWPLEPVPAHPRVSLVYHPEVIGQRAACNEAARISTTRYVMKVDAHCSFDEGFDVKLMADMQDDWTVVPIMRHLHAFDWVCKKCGDRRYQGPTPTSCPKCENVQDFVREIVWRAKPSPQNKSYCFDSTPHFQYFGEYSKRPEGQGDLTETMSLQGSCFMMTRERYLSLNVCDEALGSWGSQGIEVACKTWLSGGRVMVNHKTWYAHMFRTQGADFSFPYPMSQSQVDQAREKVRDLFFNHKWEQQIHPLSWLVEKFWPVKGWTDEDLRVAQTKGVEFNERNKAYSQKREHVLGRAQGRMAQRLFDNDLGLNRGDFISSGNALVDDLDFRTHKPVTVGIIYYTDNRLDPVLMTACQQQIKQSVNGHEVISVSLRPLEFGNNLVLNKERSILTMFEQILAGLEESTADIIFLAEHDVLYHSSHFTFTPPDPSRIYYNTNVWHVRTSDGHAVHYTAKRTSQLCAYRDVLLEHYRRRVEIVKRDGFSRKQGFEPGSHHRAERIDDLQSETWYSEYPNLDLKHGGNLTQARWKPEQFRDQRNCRNWREADEIPGWGTTQQIVTRIKETL